MPRGSGGCEVGEDFADNAGEFVAVPGTGRCDYNFRVLRVRTDHEVVIWCERVLAAHRLHQAAARQRRQACFERGTHRSLVDLRRTKKGHLDALLVVCREAIKLDAVTEIPDVDRKSIG